MQRTILVLPLLFACGSPVDERRVVETLSASQVELLAYSDGSLDVRVDGEAIASRAFATATFVHEDGRERRLRSFELSPQLSVDQGEDALGSFDSLLVRGTREELSLSWSVNLYADGRFRVDAEASSSAPGWTLHKLQPFVLGGYEDNEGPKGSGLFLGEHPKTHRVMDNGRHTLIDFLVTILPGDAPRDSLLGSVDLIPGDYHGHIVSNWNQIIVDTESEHRWLAGGLTTNRSAPVFSLSYDEDFAGASGERAGFSYYALENAYLPNGLKLDEAIGSEAFLIDPRNQSPLATLEEYADAIAAYRGIVPWTQRDGGRSVPNGWNSWSGSSSTGGYGGAIDQDIILDNLEVMATQLRDWGFDWFQVDIGYQHAWGDWDFRADIFPDGAAWLTSEIRARGLRPGLWMAAFTPDEDSELAQDHPEWMATKLFLGNLVGNNEILDLSHPEVLSYLRTLISTMKNDWGFEWLKLDFAYQALLAKEYYDESLTREEAWRGALSAVKQELGENAFFLLVGTIGLNYGIVDGARTTLDSQPVWDVPPATNELQEQSLKATMRTAGRRWYLQDRVWVNHPDLIFFRSNPEEPNWPRLTLEESQAFAAFVGLSGGIVKLGDKLVDMDADAINTVRTLVPIYGKAARPLDLFAREFPEKWHLPVTEPKGEVADYHLIGLFDWGKNTLLDVTPVQEREDSPTGRNHELALEEIGLEGAWLAYEFWTGEFLGTVEETLSLEVPRHASRVVALRKPTGEPQFLGWNRHITMGAVVLQQAAFDAESGSLSLAANFSADTEEAPFVYKVAIYVPEGFSSATISPPDGIAEVRADQEGEILRLSFRVTTTGPSEIVIPFTSSPSQ